jgi:hypothetical protein
MSDDPTNDKPKHNIAKRSIDNLRPFKKGDDPNRFTEGRPRKNYKGVSLPEYARRHTGEALDACLAVMRDPTAKHRDVLTAANILFNRGWGLPNQQIKADIQHRHIHATLDASKLSPEVREAILLAATAQQHLATDRSISIDAIPSSDAEEMIALPDPRRELDD